MALRWRGIEAPSHILGPSPPCRQEPMPIDLTSTLRALLESHGIATGVNTAGDIAMGSSLRLSPSVVSSLDKPSGKLIQVDVRAQSPMLGDKLLIESFAGYGADESNAALQALEKFSESSLHVLLTVFLGEGPHTNQIEWETWKSGDKQWRVCLGPLLLQHSAHIEIRYGEFLDQIKEKLLAELSDGLHWLRVYFMKNGSDRIGSESLLDNTDWIEGRRLVDSWSWPDGTYSARQFLILVPQKQA
jgi:uncharacterized protein DUF6348